MAETDPDFPLNLTDDFRPYADVFVRKLLGYGDKTSYEEREQMRGILLTKRVEEAEVFAMDLLLPFRECPSITISFTDGPGGWFYKSMIEGYNVIGVKIVQPLCSDHLCRIVTRMVENRPNVELLGWPEEWPMPRFRIGY